MTYLKGRIAQILSENNVDGLGDQIERPRGVVRYVVERGLIDFTVQSSGEYILLGNVIAEPQVPAELGPYVLGIWSTERQHDALVQQMGSKRPLPFLFDMAVEFLVRNDIDIPLMVGEFGKLNMETALERLGAFRRVLGLNW